MPKKIKILFISHDTTQTGAPILLLNLARLLKNKNYQIKFIVKNENGPLLSNFKNLGEVLIINRLQINPIKRKCLEIFKRLTQGIEIKRYLSDTDLILSNTITNGDILPLIRQYYAGTIISYIHELEIASQFYTKESHIKSLLACSNVFAIPSNAVEKHLIKNLGVNQSKIHYLNYFIPQISSEINLKNECRLILKLPQDSFIIGGVGTIDWRKGPDIFIAIAKSYITDYPNTKVTFVWFGAEEGINLTRLNYEIRKMNLQNSILFILASNKTPAFFKAIDLFLLTSREDPYPLVVLEAANAKKPIICFESAGGASEFVGEDAGIIVPFLDIDAAKIAINNYLSDINKIHNDGEIAYQKVKYLHQNEELILSQFNKLINDQC